jgi:DNA primase
MTNELLINLVDSVLGQGKRTSKGNKAYHCPFCNHHKLKLEINFTIKKDDTNNWHCWVCNRRGKRISSLFKSLKVSSNKFSELRRIIKVDDEYIDEVNYENVVELPKEYKSLINDNSLLAKRAKNYLRKRGITSRDIIKYNIGYCDFGEYINMLIIPSYDEDGNLNFFTARSFLESNYKRFQNPEFNKNIVFFELFINWDSPIILCEGPFDAMTIRRNAIPLLGKTLQSNLRKKLISSRVKKIYLALDTDAMSKTLELVEYFLDENKEVYLIELNGKDPSEIGFENFTNLIHNAEPLDYYDLMEKKLFL